MVALGRDIFVIGGMIPDETVPLGASATGRVEVYDTRRGSWSTAAPVPVAMNHLNATVVGGKIYVLGGLSGGAAWHAMPNSYVYDPKTNAWTALAPMPTGTWRGSAVMGVSARTIHLAGGMRTLVPGPGGVHDTVSTVTSYNVATGRWATLPSLPQPRDHAGGGVVHGVLYVIGGREGDPENVRGTVYALDLRTERWSERAPMPTPRGGIAAAIVHGTIYTFGGEGNPASGSDGVYPQTEGYDTVHNTWRKLEPMPVPRHGTGAAAVGGTLYIPGGGVDQGAGLVAVNQSYRPPPGLWHLLIADAFTIRGEPQIQAKCGYAGSGTSLS